MVKSSLIYYLFLKSMALWQYLTTDGGMKVLIDKKMRKVEIRKRVDIVPNMLTKLNRNKEVSMMILGKICHVLGTDFGENVEYIDDNKAR